ncbi:MAG TPA: aminotransferase class V-fold PLP-dependent enzyme [Anaerolineales bacterium]|nr:aminotransferase class V-fold PLP-dependent enzyme [Anaerolineales bacterium]
MANTFTLPHYPALFTGIDVQIPVLDGSHQRYINLDNAASTPPFKAVQQAINDFMVYYSSVHRGTGFKSQISTHAYEASRQTVLQFVGGDPHRQTCIFGKNATEALNKLARRFPFTPHRDVVLTSGMEHHSNDLPWRAVAKVIHIGLHPDGRLDEADFDAQLVRHSDRVALVAISGASNVTGYLNPIHRLAEKAHAAGAQVAVDCAQLAPHRRVDMRSLEDPAHLDYVAISAHKLYAPFGTGALVGLRQTFEHGDPDLSGGGTVEIVTLDDVVWADPPDREEAGSPNTVGAVALAAAIRQLEAIGLEAVASHEAELTAYALRKMTQVPGLQIYGDGDPARAAERLGVIPFKIEGYSHFLVAAILGFEFGIGVRSGCFCAHPYILHLLGLSPEQARTVRERMLAGDKSNMPGLVRISFGLYNTILDIDALVEALTDIVHGQYQGNYVQESSTGEFTPLGWAPDFDQYFS